VGEERCVRDFGGETQEERKIMLNCLFKKWDRRAWIGSMWLRIGTDGGHL